jgi:O-acetyl-ADP-ribose deacetylase (regulator of RNase III)
MECCFVDIDEIFIKHIAELCSNLPFVTCKIGNIKDEDYRNTAFVSPANSLISMDKGIDKIYNNVMFEKVHIAIQRKLKKLGILSNLGRHYLPVGSAMILPVIPESNTFLLVSPTMFLPQDVSMTNNAYHAFMACLCLLKKYNSDNIQRLVCCGLCTGNGKMKPEISARQIYTAIMDFKSFRNIPRQIHLVGEDSVYIAENIDYQQPNYYENREIKNIIVNEIIFHR